MNCLYCGEKLGLFARRFCNAKHQELWRQRESEMAIQRLMDPFGTGGSPATKAPLPKRASDPSATNVSLAIRGEKVAPPEPREPTEDRPANRFDPKEPAAEPVALSGNAAGERTAPPLAGFISPVELRAVQQRLPVFTRRPEPGKCSGAAAGNLDPRFIDQILARRAFDDRREETGFISTGCIPPIHACEPERQARRLFVESPDGKLFCTLPLPPRKPDFQLCKLTATAIQTPAFVPHPAELEARMYGVSGALDNARPIAMSRRAVEGKLAVARYPEIVQTSFPHVAGPKPQAASYSETPPALGAAIGRVRQALSNSAFQALPILQNAPVVPAEAATAPLVDLLDRKLLGTALPIDPRKLQLLARKLPVAAVQMPAFAPHSKRSEPRVYAVFGARSGVLAVAMAGRTIERKPLAARYPETVQASSPRTADSPPQASRGLVAPPPPGALFGQVARAPIAMAGRAVQRKPLAARYPEIVQANLQRHSWFTAAEGARVNGAAIARSCDWPGQGRADCHGPPRGPTPALGGEISGPRPGELTARSSLTAAGSLQSNRAANARSCDRASQASAAEFYFPRTAYFANPARVAGKRGCAMRRFAGSKALVCGASDRADEAGVSGLRTAAVRRSAARSLLPLRRSRNRPCTAPPGRYPWCGRWPCPAARPNAGPWLRNIQSSSRQACRIDLVHSRRRPATQRHCERRQARWGGSGQHCPVPFSKHCRFCTKHPICWQAAQLRPAPIYRIKSCRIRHFESSRGGLVLTLGNCPAPRSKRQPSRRTARNRNRGCTLYPIRRMMRGRWTCTAATPNAGPRLRNIQTPSRQACPIELVHSRRQPVTQRHSARSELRLGERGQRCPILLSRHSRFGKGRPLWLRGPPRNAPICRIESFCVRRFQSSRGMLASHAWKSPIAALQTPPFAPQPKESEARRYGVADAAYDMRPIAISRRAVERESAVAYIQRWSPRIRRISPSHSRRRRAD